MSKELEGRADAEEWREVMSGLSSSLGSGLGGDNTTPEQMARRIEAAIGDHIGAFKLRVIAAIERVSMQPPGERSWGDMIKAVKALDLGEPDALDADRVAWRKGYKAALLASFRVVADDVHNSIATLEKAVGTRIAVRIQQLDAAIAALPPTPDAPADAEGAGYVRGLEEAARIADTNRSDNSDALYWGRQVAAAIRARITEAQRGETP